MFTFCKPVTSKKRFLPFRPINNEYAFSLFDRAKNIVAEDWDAITGRKTVFLERDYLEVVEDAGHARLNCRYVIVYHKKKPCGVIYFQVVDFKAGVFGNLIRREVEELRTKKMNLFERYLHSNREEVLLRLFTCGNNLISGEYGFLFDKKAGREKCHELLLKVIDTVSREEKLRGTISAVLLKDFFRPLRPKAAFDEEKYSAFKVEPDMIIDLPGEVRSVSEYIARFSKKYRNRAKGILRNRESFEIRTLDAPAIAIHEKEIYRLYSDIFGHAKFKLLKLPRDYFSRLKLAFPDIFSVKGFFQGDKLLAFGSSFRLADGTLDAHYIGFDYPMNQQYDLYQNLLYLMIEEAIAGGCSRVNLGRTAAEIKSTVGARPVDLICYIKPQNAISRLIQRPFISFLQPAPWTQRNPFREEREESVKKEA